MLRMLILADDLSGAADCGAACAGAGLKTVVSLGAMGDHVDADVLSVDGDTRSMSPGAAAAEVHRLIRQYAPDEELLLFKKIDSTLRGNIAVELTAALDAYSCLHPGVSGAVALMAPAFPAIGRTTVNGFQLVHGHPLHDTDVWRIQGIMGQPYIPDMLKCAGLKGSLLQLGVVRSAAHALADAMAISANDSDVLVCDAETDADLGAIARVSMQLRRKVIWVGSAGLAYHLPRAAGLAKAGKVAEGALPPLSGPLLFVIGSLSRNSIEQVRLLTSSSHTLRISVPPEVLLAGVGSTHWQDYQRELEHAIGMNQDVVLGPMPEPQVELSKRPLLSAGLAQMTSSITSEIGALIVAGGENARTVLQGWGITGLRLIGELERGIPVSITEDWKRQLLVVTKAGDFGNPEALFNCRQFLHSADRRLNPPHDIRKVTK